MEAETGNTNTQLGFLHRLHPAVVPVLLISVGYVDPGKWVATIEGGARFGSDLVVIMLLFNFAGILCQYVSARISVATGKNLAQICTDEYDKWTCMFLGTQAELSAILLDLTMVVGVAHALNILFGVDLSTGVFLAAIDAVLFPVFATILENRVANTVSVFAAGIVLLFYVSGVLFSQPEIPLSINGIFTRLNGESVFTLMSLLGASVMPHKFYLHSYLALERSSPADGTRSSLCQGHFFAIICAFSGLYLLNFVLMNVAANVFHSTGLVLLTFQDAMSLMEQVFRSPMVPIAFLVLMFISNQIAALAWAIGGEVVLHDFLKIDIPNWLHRATIRIVAVAPALYCVWTSGAEGLYHLLIFTQVLVALLLPASVIPLFRIASSRQVMGIFKISQTAEFLALATFMGMLGLNIVFVVEMVFGNSDWAGSLRWSTGSGASVSYITLLVSACASLCLMFWLVATPLKSAANRLDAQAWYSGMDNSVPDPYNVERGVEIGEIGQHKEELVQMQEPLPLLGNNIKDRPNMGVGSPCYNLPESILMSEQEIRSSPFEDKNLKSDADFSAPKTSPGDVLEVKNESTSQSTVVNEVIDDDLVVETKTVKVELPRPVEKIVSVENNSNKDVDRLIEESDSSWELEATPKAASPIYSSFVSDGPPSFRSLSGKSDEGGSGAGSLSRLAGLGRAARRHLAAILDEFWGHLYDFHGQVVAGAKANKLDLLLGVDPKTPSCMKVDSNPKDTCGYFGRGSESVTSPGSYDSLKQLRTQGSVDSLYGLQRGSSSPLSTRMQLLDAYVKSTKNVLESGEKRYSSLRTLPSSEIRDYQPATVHGYHIASCLNRLAKERSIDTVNAQAEIAKSRSPSLGSMSYTDQLAFALRQKSQNCWSSRPAPGFENFRSSRNVTLQPQRSYYGVASSVHADDADEKRYCSLPNISGLSVSNHDPRLSQKDAYLDGSTGYGTSFSRSSNECSMYTNSASRLGAPLAFDLLSPSRGYKCTNSNTGSLWSRQPFEQFGVAEKGEVHGDEGPVRRSNSMDLEVNPAVDSEAILLKSFRCCILKLLKLEGADWLFGQNDGVDEELIDRVAAREKFIYEVESREISQLGHVGEPLVSSVPHCGEGCIWRADVIVSFGVWCIHRILDLSLMESRPELWGKYTYVLNRLQGVIDPAFSKPRTPGSPCFCLQIPATHQQRASPPTASNGMLPPAAKPARGKCTTAATVLDVIKDVEIAISCRKGRSGTAAGDVAFPKGKENLASVLKRYKRRLSSKLVSGTQEGSGSRKNMTSLAYGS